MDVWPWVGVVSSGLFLFSWMVQAWETRKAGSPVVTLNFFLIRLVASVGLLFEAIRVSSPGLVISMVGTSALIVYNVVVLRRAGRRSVSPDTPAKS